MKKQFYLILAILVAFSSLIISCDESEQDSNICKITVTHEGNGTVSITNYVGAFANVLIGNNVEVVATPAEGNAFIGWYLVGSETPVSMEEKYVFTASENITLIAKFIKPVGEAIDLGLSVKWASFNVGASSPEDYGGYYAWGETEEKEYYDWGTYKLCNASHYTMTKYCTISSYGTVDNKTTLDPEDDVAHVKWGGSWRMPTKAEQDELRNNCTWTWTTQNGVKGYKLTGPNGNSIFLPAAGFRFGADVYSRGDYGYYWSSSLGERYSYNAYYLYFNGGYFEWNGSNRYNGRSVRPVSE